jgi:hypothetical protein
MAVRLFPMPARSRQFAARGIERERRLEIGLWRPSKRLARQSVRMRRAHGSSASADSGLQMKTRRRLSVSLTPVTLKGPEMSTPGMVG